MNFEERIKELFKDTNYSNIRYEQTYTIASWDIIRKGTATQRIEFWMRSNIINWKTPTIRRNKIDNHFMVNGIYLPQMEQEKRDETYLFIAKKISDKALDVLSKIVKGYEYDDEPMITLQMVVDGNYNSHQMTSPVTCEDGTIITPSQLKEDK